MAKRLRKRLLYKYHCPQCKSLVTVGERNYKGPHYMSLLGRIVALHCPGKLERV